MSITDIKRTRNLFLLHLYGVTQGDTSIMVNEDELGAELGLDPQDTAKIVTYLCDAGLTKRETFTTVSITHYGVNMAEDLVESDHRKTEEQGTKDVRSSDKTGRPTIFISHINQHKNLAIAIKLSLLTAFENRIDIFVSSDIHDISGGEEWKSLIKEKLRLADLFVVMLNELSIQRPWINFETGCAWIADIPILSLCFGDVKIGNLPKPYDDFQALEMVSEDLYEDLLTSIKKHLGPDFDAKRYRSQFLLTVIPELERIKSNQEEIKTQTESEAIKQELTKEETHILVALSTKDSGGHVGYIVSITKITPPKCRYFLDLLIEKKLISNPYTLVDKGPIYSITKEGRAYLFDHGLLE